jgi:hypothetical protein
MYGLMPSDSGYDLNLYPNLARYQIPQRDINNDNSDNASCNATDDDDIYNTTDNSYYSATDSNTYSYTAYGPCPINNPYQPPNQLIQEQVQAQQQQQEVDDEEEEEEEEEFPFRPQTTPPTPPTRASTLPIARKPALPPILVRLFASDILMWGDEWRRCPACLGGKVCLVRGKCIEDGRRVKVMFW